MESKKGAVELSMTTVIVIILGVVLLTLGLAFVRNIFGKVGGLTEGAFDEAQAAIGKLGTIDSELTLTSKQVSLTQGEAKGVGIVVANLGEKEGRFQVKVSIPSRPGSEPKFRCDIGETLKADSDEIVLTSGDKEDYTLLIDDSTGPSNIGTYVCKVSLFKDGKLLTDSSVIINVEA